MRDRVDAVLRAARNLVLGRPRRPLIDAIAIRDPRWNTFVRAAEFVHYERVAGDVLEFGVFGGLSLALLARAVAFEADPGARRVVGFDSFEGLPPSADAHPRWRPGDCGASHGWHPLLAPGAPVTAEATRALFSACRLAPPHLEVGRFADTIHAAIPARYAQAALVHVDCDLYESTRDVLEGLAPALQDGTVLLFDDWFHYRGRPDRGEQRAFAEFLDKHPEWGAAPWGQYATFCQAFILSRR